MSELIFPFINLAILIAVMVVYLRAPLRAFVNDRHTGLREELSRVRDMLTQAQGRYNEFTSKLKAMDAEIANLRDQAKQDAAGTKSRILAEAQKLSAAIVSDSRVSAQGLYAQLKSELFADIGTKVLDRAEALMRERLTGDDRARIQREFSNQVESVQ